MARPVPIRRINHDAKKAPSTKPAPLTENMRPNAEGSIPSTLFTYRSHTASSIELKISIPPIAPAIASRTLFRQIRARPWRASLKKPPAFWSLRGSGSRALMSPMARAETTNVIASTISAMGAVTVWINTPATPGPATSAADPPIASLLFASTSWSRETRDGSIDLLATPKNRSMTPTPSAKAYRCSMRSTLKTAAIGMANSRSARP